MSNTEFKSISTKVPRSEYLLILDYCNKKPIRPSKLIRQLLLAEIGLTDPNYLAGKNTFEYNKSKDNFSWIIELDDNRKIKIEDNLSVEYLQDLKDIIEKKINERIEIIRQKKKGSVSIPKTILKK